MKLLTISEERWQGIQNMLDAARALAKTGLAIPAMSTYISDMDDLILEIEAQAEKVEKLERILTEEYD